MASRSYGERSLGGGYCFSLVDPHGGARSSGFKTPSRPFSIDRVSLEEATVTGGDGKDARSIARLVMGNGLGTVAPLVLMETSKTCHSTIIIPTTYLEEGVALEKDCFREKARLATVNGLIAY